MLKTIIRGSGPAIAVLVFLVGLAPKPADAQSYSSPSNGICLNNSGNAVPLSYCTPTLNFGAAIDQALAQAVGGQTATTSVGNTAAYHLIYYTPPSGTAASAPATFGNFYDYDVAPASGHLSIQGVGVGGVYSRTAFSDNVSGLGYSRIEQTAGITASYAQDFGDWGFTAVLPVTQSSNNNGYQAFDNTSVGLAVVPVYHLLFEQVAGIALDVGGVLGGQYTGYDHLSDLANGPLGLTGFENPASGQVGALITATKTVAAATRLSLGASVVDNHNFTGYEVLGQDALVTTANLGVSQGLSSALFLTANLSLVNLDQFKWGIDRNYGEGALGLGGHLSPRASLTLQASRTFDNSAWSTTSGTVNFVWWLN